jgi:hypothetical protein
VEVMKIFAEQVETAAPVHTLPKEFFADPANASCLRETVEGLDPVHVKRMIARTQARIKDLDDVTACLCCDKQVLARNVCTYSLTGSVPRHIKKLRYYHNRLKLDPVLRQLYKLPIASETGIVQAEPDDEDGWQRLLASPRAVRTSDSSVNLIHFYLLD